MNHPMDFVSHNFWIFLRLRGPDFCLSLVVDPECCVSFPLEFGPVESPFLPSPLEPQVEAMNHQDQHEG